ncbi:MAG: hypothetical protein Q7J35_13510 [Candidatus Methanoperedens sp.]|nr:hypothetical protein [Candidatus Methanoperedens sp.]
MSYPKYGWVGNRIAEEDMASLYRMKIKTRLPITAMVAEAVSQYLESKGFSYPVGHCKPLVGYNEQGHACSSCPLRRDVQK